MKKFIRYITVASMAILLAASCDKNLEPVFDDANAFIAFSSKNYTLPEDGTLRIPVSLASVSGLEGSATFTIVEDKDSKVQPVEGTDYQVNTIGGTLKFDAENRTQYIALEGIVNGIYTGDMSFFIELSTSLDLGSNAKCKVTISDIDHPLTPILGGYVASGTDYWAGASTWGLTLSKDADGDIQKVWFSDLANIGAGLAQITGPVYGIVNEDMTSIELSFEQDLKDYATYDLKFYGFDAASDDYVKSGKCEVKIVWENGAVKGLEFPSEQGFYVGTDTYDIMGIVKGDITAVKN